MTTLYVEKMAKPSGRCVGRGCGEPATHRTVAERGTTAYQRDVCLRCAANWCAQKRIALAPKMEGAIW